MKQTKVDKTNALRELDTAKIQYTIHTYEYDDEHIDGISVATTLHQDVQQVFKTLLTTDGKHHYFVFCIPVNESLDLKKCAKVAGVKSLEMVHVKDLLNLTGYVRGGCSPVGMKKHFDTFIEETAQLFDTIFVSAGKKGMQMEVDPIELCQLIHAQFVSICQ